MYRFFLLCSTAIVTIILIVGLLSPVKPAEQETVKASEVVEITLPRSEIAESMVARVAPDFPYPEQYATAIESASKEFSVPLEIMVAMTMVESSFIPGQVSVANAKGLFQIKPSTAAYVAANQGWLYYDGIEFSMRDAAFLAAAYLQYLYTKYEGLGYSEVRTWQYVLLAYNLGPTGAKRQGLNPEASNYVQKIGVVLNQIAEVETTIATVIPVSE